MAIDDFGTGYSGLCPTSGACRRSYRKVLLSGVIDTARGLGLAVCAEAPEQAAGCANWGAT